MLVNTQAELMYPSLAGLGGLGCADCFNTCGCSSNGLGAVDVLGASWCGSGNPFIDIFCSEESKKTVMEQIITDPSNYGTQLTPESRARAEEMAREVIAGDNPCNYSELSTLGWMDKLSCSLSGTPGKSNLLLIGGVAIVAVLILKR